MTRALIAFITVSSAAWCQTPVISSLVNSASYQPTLGERNSVATIFGTHLAASTATAQAVPLPLQLGGTSVTFYGVAAPLFYVSPTQINLLVPDGSLTGNGVIVATAAGTSPPYEPYTATPNTWNTGAIFTMDASGCGQGAVLNVAADGSLSVNSPTNSASPGDWISIYGTGFGSYYASEIDSLINVPAPSNPPVGSLSGGGAQFDFLVYSGPGSGWAGLAPGFVGLEQDNAQIPSTVREGCAVPLQVPYDNGALAISQPVTIAIHQGGGACVNPPSAGYGQITWQKTISTTGSNVVSETDTMTASLQASPGQQAPPAPAYNEGGLQGSQTLSGPACPVPGYLSLGAGTVTAQGPGLAPAQVPIVPFQQGQLGGLSAYQATFPSGTIQPGNFTVTASGGADVGAFQASVKVGADIQLQTPLAGVTVCSSTIKWTGGDPNSWVTIKFVQLSPPGYGSAEFVNFGAQARTSDGAALILLPDAACGSAPEPIQIVIEVDPDPSEITTFSASALSLGGRATWRYIHTFQAALE
jgi:uncharacterized protein (TIGR03437 family)